MAPQRWCSRITRLLNQQSEEDLVKKTIKKLVLKRETVRALTTEMRLVRGGYITGSTTDEMGVCDCTSLYNCYTGVCGPNTPGHPCTTSGTWPDPP